jgi:2-polyprenyl-3-methyl-5-hydroxy-6-metoxy-1,4-benzoquinol methylase
MYCPACGPGVAASSVTAPERMFGFGGTFTYTECPTCGGLQLQDPPDDLAVFYPEGYYAFHPAPAGLRGGKFRRARTRLALRHPRLAQRLYRGGQSPPWAYWLLGRSVNDRVLDVGCGNARLLRELAANGFSFLVGADPFVTPAELSSGVTIRANEIAALEGKFDVILLNDSVEHLPDQRTVFRHLRRLLAPHGLVFIRTPLADSWARHHYGPEWVQLDPPRHLFIHTEESMRRLATSVGLYVVRSRRDSTGLQIWGSELYRSGETLSARGETAFAREQLAEFTNRARQLDRAGEGDEGAFWIAAEPVPQGLYSKV